MQTLTEATGRRIADGLERIADLVVDHVTTNQCEIQQISKDTRIGANSLVQICRAQGFELLGGRGRGKRYAVSPRNAQRLRELVQTYPAKRLKEEQI